MITIEAVGIRRLQAFCAVIVATVISCAPSARAVDVVAAASAGALLSGVDLINAISVGVGPPLEDYYTDNVIGGSVYGLNSTIVDVPTVATFQTEVGNLVGNTVAVAVPEPQSILLLGLGSLLVLRRRR